jgi:uncharacterized protein (TIGR03437 family)
MQKILKLLIALLSVYAAAPAATTFYTNQAEFATAATSLVSFGFNCLVTGSGAQSYDTAQGVTVNGIQFIGATGTPSKPYFLSAEGPNYFYNDYNRLPGQSSLQGPGVSSVFYSVTNGVTTINMPPGGVTAFGMVLFDVLIGDTTGAGTDTVNLNVNGSTGSVVTPAFTGTAFIGFTSTVPVTSVTLTGTKADEYPTISSVYYQPAVTLATPLISCGGIVPIFNTSTTIQPGEWISIYGSNLAAASATWNGDFPTLLGNTSVTIDGQKAYLWYVSPGQINAQVPADGNRGSVPVVITTPGGTASANVVLAAYAPSFSLLVGEHVAAIIIRTDGSGAYGGGTYDIVGPTGDSLGFRTVAAKAGDVVELFAVGLGPTTPVVQPGQTFSGAAPTDSAVSLSINGHAVTPSFAGIIEAGLYQINMTIPAGFGAGDLPIIATVAGVQTQTGVVISLQ